MASASRDDTVRLWDARSGQEQQTLKGHSSWVTAVAFSPDGLVVASASNDQTVKLWDAQSDQEQQTLKGHSHGFSLLARRISSTIGIERQDRQVWDAQSGRNMLFKSSEITQGF